MITYRKAKELLEPGETVYTTSNGKIVEHSVMQILKDHLLTDKGTLHYDNHGITWWLTREGVLL